LSLAPVPSDGATCANCSAPLVADQRYCLSCGQPTTPVRLAFLDVLQNERQPQLASGSPYGAATPAAYAPMAQQPSAAPEWLRRYAPLLAVVSVLLLAMIVGLLVGHWVTQSKSSSGPEVVKIQGLSAGAAVAPTASATPTTPTSTPAATSSKPSAKSEAAEVKKEAKVEKQQAAKVEHAKVVKQSSDQAKKLGSSTGKKHEEEVNALGAQPIETG
jgi:hypothetical protein